MTQLFKKNSSYLVSRPLQYSMLLVLATTSDWGVSRTMIDPSSNIIGCRRFSSIHRKQKVYFSKI
jgi:hypothetical protein